MSKLQEAFRETARREFAMVPTENEIDYAFSSGFQRKMRRIIRAQVHGYWQFVNTTAKRIACVAAIIVMLLTTAMAIKPIRERVIRFFVEIYEEYFAVTFGAEESGDLYYPPEPMTRYTLSWVPTGYHEVKYIETDVTLTTIWTDEDGSSILLSQGRGTQTITMNLTESSLSEFIYGDIVVRHNVYEEANEFIWEQDGFVFHLTAHTEILMTEALQMIVSLCQK